MAKSFAWSKSGHQLIYGTQEQRVHWVDTRLNRGICELPGHRDSVLMVAFTENERQLISVDSRLSRRRWGIVDARWPHRLVEAGNLLALVAPEAGGLISAGLGQHGICLWDLERGACETRLPFRSEEVRALAVTSNGRHLAAAGKAGELLLWDLKTRLPLAPLFGHRADVRSVAFSKDDAWLVSADLNGDLKRWNVRSAKKSVEQSAASGVNAARFSPDGKLIALGTRGAQVELWDHELGARIGELNGHTDWVMDLRFVSGSQLATAGADHSVRLWDLSEQRQIAEFNAGRARVLTLDVSGDGRYLAAGGEDKLVRVWDLEAGQLVATLNDHEGAVRSLGFLAKSRTLASASDDRSVRLWDLEVLETEPDVLLRSAEKRYGIKADAVELVE